jgi:hypothetical protein
MATSIGLVTGTATGTNSPSSDDAAEVAKMTPVAQPVLAQEAHTRPCCRHRTKRARTLGNTAMPNPGINCCHSTGITATSLPAAASVHAETARGVAAGLDL